MISCRLGTTYKKWYLYVNGNILLRRTGGWYTPKYGNISTPVLYQEQSDIRVDYISGKPGVLCTNTPINLTPYKKLCANYADFQQFYLMISLDKLPDASDSSDAYQNHYTARSANLASLDISAYTGNYYVYMYTYPNTSITGHIYKIWLE